MPVIKACKPSQEPIEVHVLSARFLLLRQGKDSVMIGREQAAQLLAMLGPYVADGALFGGADGD